MNNKKLLILFLIGLILLGVIFRVLSLDNEISAEEPDFVQAAKAIRDTGSPVYYNSEQKPLEVALWHPPTYIFLLSGILNISEKEIAIRSLNILFTFLTALLIYLFCSEIIGKEKGQMIGIISSAFFMINYYIFSSSILIDIDILSMFFTLGFIYSILRYHQTSQQKYFYLSIISLVISIGNRYPMAFLVYMGVGAYYLLNKEFKKDLKNYIKIGIISASIFIVLWRIYSIFIESGNFFTFLFHNAQLGGEQLSNLGVYFGSFILNIAQFIRLFTFPAVILMIWSIFYFCKKKSHLTRILLIYSMGTLILFFLIPRPAFGYPRYFATIFPGLSILIGMFIYLKLKGLKINKKEICLMGIIFIASLTLLFFLSPQPTIYSSKGLIGATNLPDFILNLFCSIPLAIVFLFQKERKSTLMALALLVLILSYSLFFIFETINYDPQIKEVGKYIKENTQKEEILICPKSIGYYAERKFYVNDNNKPKLDFSLNYLKAYFKKSWVNPSMDEEFFWKEGLYSGLYAPLPSQKELSKASYVIKYYKLEGIEPETKIGEFYIYNVK